MASVEQHYDTQEEEKLKQAQMSSTAVSVNMNAEMGGTVNAPVLAGNTITGPVTFNYSTAGHEPRKISETAEKHTEKQARNFSQPPYVTSNDLQYTLYKETTFTASCS
ncbi:hypothetical protein G5714_019174 [Onychostoma macrolepis]|uniref:Uncharacterized protein n=1 Tax=Onychostoma macrolepis TaxID=369639 RepID=A0A7J6C128_9TELE|nr:hypothetical protein G5714_019174 [Onychostoma macrolepis]